MLHRTPPFPRILLVLLLSLMMAPAVPGIRRSPEGCEENCEAKYASCRPACTENLLICKEACERRVPGNSDCLEACQAVFDACAATCDAQVNECKAFCPEPPESPTEPGI